MCRDAHTYIAAYTNVFSCLHHFARDSAFGWIQM